MARSVADVRAMFQVMAGWDDADPMAVPLPSAGAQTVDPRGVRIGFFEDDGRTAVTEDTRAAVRTAARTAEQAGYAIEGFRPSGLDRARELWEVFFCEGALLVLEGVMHGAEEKLPILEEYLTHRGRR